MTSFKKFEHPYKYDPKYSKRVAYFSMEFALHQPLKTYSGGLGFLAGSHMRSTYELNQNMIGIGILWKHGYYDQIRKGDQSMDSLFQEKHYSFLEETKIKFKIEVNKHLVWVKVYYLKPETFGTAPIFFLSTDTNKNDYLAQSITHRLYDFDVNAKIAQSILLGVGGAKLLDMINADVEVYHLNEAHALSSVFYLYEKYKDLKEVKKRMVFTTHTPEEAGNEKHDITLLEKMSFFGNLPLEEVRKITGVKGNIFNHTLVGLRMCKIANGVSKMHGEVSRNIWKDNKGICPIIHITNAQSKKYWANPRFYEALNNGNDEQLIRDKKRMKRILFHLIADQTGKLLDENVLTIVWARRFAEYKRADLITADFERFHELMSNKNQTVQIIWAGKPYPMDFNAISTFNHLVHLSKNYKNCAVLVGYELYLSKMLKRGSDIWLNNPRITREASGTSGMTAAMNGSVNFSVQDGWVSEFANHGHNSFLIPVTDHTLPQHEQDNIDRNNLFNVLEKEILPAYYDDHHGKWLNIVKSSMKEVLPYFDSDRMAYQYYEKLYNI